MHHQLSPPKTHTPFNQSIISDQPNSISAAHYSVRIILSSTKLAFVCKMLQQIMIIQNFTKIFRIFHVFHKYATISLTLISCCSLTCVMSVATHWSDLFFLLAGCPAAKPSTPSMQHLTSCKNSHIISTFPIRIMLAPYRLVQHG